MKPTIRLLLLLPLALQNLPAQVVSGGRAGPGHFNFEVQGGIGGLDSIRGRVGESSGGVALPGGLSADLEDLGVDESANSVFLNIKAYNNWVQFLLDYRSSSLEASGTAEREFRLNVGSLAGLGGADLEYLIIPVNTEYDVDADMTWLGVGFRFTPFTINPRGSLRFTPWLHAGVQLIDADYDVNAGASTDFRVEGFPSRIYAVQGQASGSEKAGIPEYGFGGEVRYLFDPSKDFGPEIVAQATWKILDFQGALDSIGVDKSEFRDIDFQYDALEVSLSLYFPLNDSLDLIAGLYVEEVDIKADLEAKGSVGDFNREVEVSYRLYGVRAGFRF